MDDFEAITLNSGEKCTLRVTTIWVGLNMGNCDGPLQIFETAVTIAPAAPLTPLLRQRYPNKESARRGHAVSIWNVYRGKHPFDDLVPEPKCIICNTLPVVDRLIRGYWTCELCLREIRAHKIQYPVALVTW